MKNFSAHKCQLITIKTCWIKIYIVESVFSSILMLHRVIFLGKNCFKFCQADRLGRNLARQHRFREKNNFKNLTLSAVFHGILFCFLEFRLSLTRHVSRLSNRAILNNSRGRALFPSQVSLLVTGSIFLCVLSVQPFTSRFKCKSTQIDKENATISSK